MKILFPIAALLTALFFLFQPQQDSLPPKQGQSALEKELSKQLRNLEDAERHDRVQAVMDIRRNLVRIYEELGLRDKATQHCVAIAKASPTETVDPYGQIFLSMPEYPAKMLEQWRMGAVVLKFTVTAEGFVENVELISGDPEFVESASEWIKKLRYPPAIKDGEPVTTYGVIRKVTYELES